MSGNVRSVTGHNKYCLNIVLVHDLQPSPKTAPSGVKVYYSIPSFYSMQKNKQKTKNKTSIHMNQNKDTQILHK